MNRLNYSKKKIKKKQNQLFVKQKKLKKKQLRQLKKLIGIIHKNIKLKLPKRFRK